MNNSAALLIAVVFAAAPLSILKAAEVLDDETRAAVLRMKDGLLASVETEYNNIFITKQQPYVVMSFQRHRDNYTESVGNLNDPDELPVPYTRMMTLGAIYPSILQKCLMIGLGGGSLSTYFGRHMPDLAIENVELDPGVISAAKRYFGVRETERIRMIEGDGRVFLNRNRSTYDLIMIDAFRGGYVPFHLLTKEFYSLLKQRLNSDGVAVFNIHSGTRLYASTVLTLKSVFPAVDLYATRGSAIAIVGAGTLDSESLRNKAVTLQKHVPFRYPMASLLASQIEWTGSANAQLLTDDFAPVNLYDAIAESNKRQ